MIGRLSGKGAVLRLRVFRVRGGNLALDDSFRRSALYRARRRWIYRFYVALSNHLRVLQLIDYARDVIHGGGFSGVIRKISRSDLAGAPFSFGVDTFTLSTIESGDKRTWEETWRTVDAILVAAHRAAV